MIIKVNESYDNDFNIEEFMHEFSQIDILDQEGRDISLEEFHECIDINNIDVNSYAVRSLNEGLNFGKERKTLLNSIFEKLGEDADRFKDLLYDIILAIIDFLIKNGLGKAFLEWFKKIIVIKLRNIVVNMSKRLFEKIKGYFSNEDNTDKLIKATLLFTTNAVIGTFSVIITSYIVGVKKGDIVIDFTNEKQDPVVNIISSGILAPINEEIGKMIAAKGDFAKEYQIIFNLVEGGSYITLYHKVVTMPSLVLVRTIGVGFHLVNQFIHNTFQNPKFKKMLHLSDSAALTLEMGITTMLHALWNISGILGKNPTEKLLKLKTKK